MECNKDEAVRAKDIAEKKLTERNYAGAKKFALKAHNLFPGLDGLSQMLTTLEVYISADNKIRGELDWYGVLGANPLDDDETIRKQYRKLALALHPDKNKAVGAEGAFKLVAEAWCLLSDKVKRQGYDQRRGVSLVFQPRAPAAKPSGPVVNGRHQHHKKNVALPHKRKNDTFWTICHRCKTHYEYMKMYLNHTLLCPNCHEAFVASERDPPLNVLKNPQPKWSSPPQPNLDAKISLNSGGKRCTAKPSPREPPSSSFNETAFKWGPFSDMGQRGAAAASSSSVAAQAASLVQQASETVKRQREERQNNNVFKAPMERPSKKIHSENNHHQNGFNTFSVAGTATGNGGLGGSSAVQDNNKKGNSVAGRFVFMPNNFFVAKPNTTRELSSPEVRVMLTCKAKTEIQKKLPELRSLDMENISKKQSRTTVKADSNEDEEVSAKSISVPDSDFHNFDSDRTEDTFKEDQVWAAYDDDDGMPRFYARIHKVISLKPFKMRISWLNSRSNSELGPVNWIGNGFTKTSGEFRVGKHESAGGLNTFSHMVTGWEKGPRGAVRIYPKKGQVWAVYNKWSPEWDSETPEEVRHKYEMVEVVEGFSEERAAVSVALLDKVPGFKTVFRSHSDSPKEVRSFPKEELFRLSHQVPFHVLTGQEAENAPEGCLELDPAATPLELINALEEEQTKNDRGK